MSRPGARPIRPGELDAYPGYARREEIINRADYLLENYLEVPPHIQAAFDILSRKGEDWATAHPGIICNIISSLPPDLPERKIYRRDNLTEPDPENEPGYYKIMRRILLSESLFYGIDAQAPAGHLLEQFRLSSATPGSFKNQLQQAGISITTLFTFTRTISRYAKDNKMLASGEPSARSASSSKPPSAPYSKGPPTELRSGMHWKGLQQQNHDRQAYFISDMARFLRGKPDNHTTLKHLTFALPDSASPHEYLDKGILKINSRTLVFDTTLNDTLLKLIQELDVKPGVIIKEFCFWRDGEDTNLPENPPKWSDSYTVRHWLSDNYNIYHPPSIPNFHSTPTGSGFVSCNPRIYIRKNKPLKKKTSSLSVSGLLGRARSLSRGGSGSGSAGVSPSR